MAGMWRRGRRLAQRYRHGAGKSGLKGRWSGHGEDERHLGWCRSTWPKRPPRARYKAKFPAMRLFVSAKKIGARKANVVLRRANQGALSTGWAARLCCEQRGRLAAVSSQPRGVRQRVQAVGSARECARERATRERSGSQSSSVCACLARAVIALGVPLLASSDQRKKRTREQSTLQEIDDDVAPLRAVHGCALRGVRSPGRCAAAPKDKHLTHV